MNAFLATSYLAAVRAVDAYREGLYGEDDSGMTRKVVLGGVVVAIIWLALFVLDRLQKRRAAEAAEAAKSMFGDLCSLHRLTAAERKRLEFVIQKCSVQPKEAIFVMPEMLDKIASGDRDTAAWEALRKKLFGDLQAAAPTAS